MNAWEKFRNSVEHKFSYHADSLADGATAHDLADFQARLGIELPLSITDIYKNANGQNQNKNAYFFGMEFLSLEKITEKIDAELELLEQLADEWDMCSSTPKEHIRQAYVNPKWIPIFHVNGAYIGIDLDPDKNGNLGQVINFGIDDEDKFVLARSVDEFIELCTGLVSDSKEIEPQNQPGVYSYNNSYLVNALTKNSISHETKSFIPKDPGYTSIWLCQKTDRAKLEAYFEGHRCSFIHDFQINANEFNSTGSISSQDGSPGPLETWIKLELCFGNSARTALERAKELGISHVTRMYCIKEYNYEKLCSGIIHSDMAIFLGSFRTE
ncbi:MAG: SMI1/KNR4 family protein [Pseudomonas sp.]|uniref:SMI1/KNR4 family protein n=1 Tax=Pseudomonas sp. TaxID=306 RepID=UPI003399C40F